MPGTTAPQHGRTEAPTTVVSTRPAEYNPQAAARHATAPDAYAPTTVRTGVPVLDESPDDSSLPF
jgi:hypothetical protein